MAADGFKVIAHAVDGENNRIQHEVWSTAEHARVGETYLEDALAQER